MKWTVPGAAILVAVAVAAGCAGQQSSEPAAGVPVFELDPAWPRVPATLKLGDASSIGIDAKDNVWILHRPRTLKPDQAALAAPAIVIFDAEGNFVRAWGGPGSGYEWPGSRAIQGSPRHPRRQRRDGVRR